MFFKKKIKTDIIKEDPKKEDSNKEKALDEKYFQLTGKQRKDVK